MPALPEPPECLLASVRARVLARSIDFAIAFLLLIGTLSVILNETFGSLIMCLYLGLADGWPNGRSLGKLCCGLRVVDIATGRPIGMAQSLGRNLTLLIFPYELIALLCDQRQRFGDRLANTYVLRLRPRPEAKASERALRPTHLRSAPEKIAP